VIRYPKEQSG